MSAKATRESVLAYARSAYGSEPEYLWEKFPSYAVLRNTKTKKWYAVIMDVPQNKIGLSGREVIDIIAIKCDPLMKGSFMAADGVYPAYHMNKNNWITVALDGSADENMTRSLIDLSFELTG